MENWEALDIKRDGSLSLRAGLIEGGGQSCGVVVAAAYRAEELWSGGLRAPLWRCLGPFCGTRGLAHVRGVVVAAPYLCRRAVERWSARLLIQQRGLEFTGA